MKTLCLAMLATATTAANNSTLVTRYGDYGSNDNFSLDDDCTGFCCALKDIDLKTLGCTCAEDGDDGMKLTCTLSINQSPVKTDLSTILSLKPCDLKASFEVRNTDPKVDWTKTIEAGAKQQIAIPDLSWKIPGVGSLGLYADLQIEGGFGTHITVAITDCYGTKCGKDVPLVGGLGVLPYTILDDTLYFDSCPKTESTAHKLLVGFGVTAAVLIAISAALKVAKKVKLQQQKKQGALLGNEYSAMGDNA